jgi:hypothetical protein
MSAIRLKCIIEALIRLVGWLRTKRKFPALAGTYAILSNRIRHLEPLTAVAFPTFAFTAAVVIPVNHSLTSAPWH